MSRPYFSLPLTEEEQYWAGFIHADGYIPKPPLARVVVSQKERHVLEEFLKFFDQQSAITVLSGTTNFGPNVGFSASTRKGVEGLRALGIKTEPVSELYASRHFWRGMVDGDGSVTLDSRGYPVVALCSSKSRDTEAFARWVGDLFSYDGPVNLENSNHVWHVNIKAGKARALGAYLYEDSYSAVPRKRDLALTFRALDFKTKVRLIGEPSTPETHVGVYRHRRSGRFMARIGIKGKVLSLGGYDSFEEARSAYLEAARLHFVPTTRTVNTGVPAVVSPHSGD